jgi:predicted phage terminase large subunit-like protein
MTTKKPQSLKDLLADPSGVEHFNQLQLADLLTKLKGLGAPKREDYRKKWPTPADMAIELSQFNREKWVRARHLDLLADNLADLVAGKKHRLMVSLGPRHGKSELISFWFPIWLLIRDPSTKIILCSYGADLAAHFGRRVRNFINEHGPEFGLTLRKDTAASYRWELDQGGGMVTAGVGGPIVGRGAHVFIVDDIHKNREEASSDIVREKAIEWWQGTAIHRLEPGAPAVIVATRWHHDDLIGRLESLSNSGEGQTWDVINLPAFAGVDDVLGREIGEPLWPERWDKKALLEIKKGMTPFDWSAIFQGQPTPEDGGAIQRGWWRYYDNSTLPEKFDQMIMSWDLAFKDLKKSDYTVGQVWGRKGANYYLLYQTRKRIDAPTTIAEFRHMHGLYPEARAKLIEDAANGPAVYQMLRHEIPGIMLIKAKKSKDARLSAIAPLIQAGNVYLPSPTTTPWVNDFIFEHSAFPNGANDDQVDATTQALNYLSPQGRYAERDSFLDSMQVPSFSNTQELYNQQFSKWANKRKSMLEKSINRSNGELLHRQKRTSGW